jgi:catechol 2,3-dioxygenase-like lactoylglutathione lyase family enzyme
MGIQRMDHVGIVVDDLEAATEFFVELGMVLDGKATLGGDWVDRIIGLKGVQSDVAYLKAPNGDAALELSKFLSPPSQGESSGQPANTRGLRHISFLVDDIDVTVAGLRARDVELVGEVVRYENIYRVCYVRGPEGILVELAQQIG